MLGLSIDVVQNCALVSTIAFFLTGTLTSRKIISTKSVADVNYLPYIITTVSCSLWVLYGYIARDQTLCTVNGVGALLQLAYLAVYLKYVEDKNLKAACLRWLSAALSFIALAMLFCHFTYKDDGSTQRYLGLFCDGMTICMFASPLSTVRDVIKTKSTASLSFPLSVMTVVLCVLWTMYGYMRNDIYVQVPNALGALLGVAQVGLFCQYPSGKTGAKQGFMV